MAGGKKRLTKPPPAKAKEPSGKPFCPVHAEPMFYDPEHLRWECRQTGCKMVAFPKEAAEKGKPILGKGDLELVLTNDPEGDKQGRFILRAMDNNVMIDITDIIWQKEKQPNGSYIVNLHVLNTLDSR